MKTYFECYLERINANHSYLMELADKLVNLGYVVRYHRANPLKSGINIYTADMSKGVRLQFNEVPYRWSLEYSIKPSAEKGSGYTGTENHEKFELSEILENMRPMYIDNRFDNMYITHK